MVNKIANEEDKKLGWRFDYKWLLTEKDAIEKATGYQITLETLDEAYYRASLRNKNE